MLDQSFDASPAGHPGKGGRPAGAKMRNLERTWLTRGDSGSTCQRTDKAGGWGASENNPGRFHEAYSVTFRI